MSRPAAPQKDGEPPCKVVVVGTEGQDPGAVEEVNRRLRGTINAFYLSSRQNGDNAQGGLWYAHRKLPGGQGMLHYSSSQGMETMTIQLRPENVPEFKPEPEKPKERQLPDYCVVDLVIPNSVDIRGDFIAVVVGGDFDGVQETDSQDLGDDSENDPAAFRPIRYARQVTPTYELTSVVNRVSSLKFDLRRMVPGDRTVVDLYGLAAPNDQPEASGATRTQTRQHEWVELLPYTEGPYRYKHSSGTTTHWSDPSTVGVIVDDYRDPLGNPVAGYSTGAEMPASWYDGLFNSLVGDVSTYDRITNYEQTFGSSNPGFIGAGLNYRFQRIDQASGLVYYERKFWLNVGEEYIGPSTFRCPYDNTLASRDRFYTQSLESVAEWTITPGTNPEPFATEADVVYGFYFGDPRWEVGRTPHQDQYIGPPPDYAAVWTLQQEAPAERTLYPAKAPLTATPGSGPEGYAYIGQIVVDRAAVTMQFTPA